MARKTKIPFGPTGKLMEATELDITSTKEQWSDYTLEDGTEIRIKNTVLAVSKIEGEYDQEGNPVYVVKGAPLIVVNANPSLKKKIQ